MAKNNSKNRSYTNEFKESVLKSMTLHCLKATYFVTKKAPNISEFPIS